MPRASTIDDAGRASPMIQIGSQVINDHDTSKQTMGTDKKPPNPASS